MKFLIQFAFKNIWRYKKRTIITFIAISVGIAGFIYLDSMLKGVFNASVKNLIDYESSHLKIYNKEFYKEMNEEGFLLLEKSIKNYENVTAIIESKGLKTAPRISFSARLVNEKVGGERPFIVVGIDPEKDKNVYMLDETIISGNFIKNGEYGIIIGDSGAKKMGIELGDPLTVFTRTKYDTYQTIMMEVVGIFSSPNPNLNRTYAYIPLDIADDNLGMEGDITEICVRAKDDNVETLTGIINDTFQKNNMPQLEAIPWTELGKDMLTLNKTKMSGSYIIILLVFIISTVGIINTMLMSVFERVKEIGMMRALGMKDSEVLLSFIFEGALIGLLGAVSGVIIGIGLNIHLIYYGIKLDAFSNMDIGYRVADVMKGVWNIESIVFAFMFSIIISALISIYPSRKAIKMQISKSLKAV